jgi:VanZ family protein
VISTFLVNNAALVPIAFWIAVAATATIGWLLYRFSRRRTLAVLAAVSLMGVLALTLSPSSSENLAFCTVQFSVPFRGIDTLANLAMTVPMTLFAALALRRPLPVLAAVSGLSALIELAQAVMPALGRACDTDDWFMNTVGAALGAGLAIAVIAVETRRQQRKAQAQPQVPASL